MRTVNLRVLHANVLLFITAKHLSYLMRDSQILTIIFSHIHCLTCLKHTYADNILLQYETSVIHFLMIIRHEDVDV